MEKPYNPLQFMKPGSMFVSYNPVLTNMPHRLVVMLYNPVLFKEPEFMSESKESFTNRVL